MEDYDNVMNVNARGVMLCVRAVSKMMLAQPVQTVRGRSGTREIGRGSIVNIGSGNSYAPLKGKTAYVTSKHAALGISKVAGESSEDEPRTICTDEDFGCQLWKWCPRVCV